MRCFVVSKSPQGEIGSQVTDRPESELPEGDTVIEVHWSSLNFKDGLAATGHPGVVKSFPHVPGIDAAGKVLESAAPHLRPGDPVIVTSYGLGADRWGAWAEKIRVPHEWVVPLPQGLTTREAMIIGTAGFTAAMCVERFEREQLSPGSGPILVTGASGGVGSIAVRLLTRLGYQVAAVSGKAEARADLERWGVSQLLRREEMLNSSSRPLLAARWAGAVDTVGGSMLPTILRELKSHGCVAACGLVGGAEFSTSVYPFLLRGVTLAGIDSAWYPAAKREPLWKRLASSWKPRFLEDAVTQTDLDGLPPLVQQILAGNVTGRVIVRIRNDSEA